MVLTVIACTVLYMSLGALTFFGIWKENEEDVVEIYKKPRVVRIALRICAIVLWPALFLLVTAGLVWNVMKFFWKSLTE